MSLRAVRRPVFIASYATTDVAREVTETVDVVTPVVQLVTEPKLRQDFPPAESIYQGGYSDGYCYQSTFAAGRLENTYAMVVEFLREEGYADVPLPANVAELRAFRLPPKLRHQLSLFGEDGYVHNPVKILFPPPGGRRGSLLLEIYDEAAPDHLLKFHRRK